MQFNLFHWLFDDAVTAGSNGNLPGAEPFHYFWPYLIACGVGLLIWFYYWVEGRKRFVKHTHYPKEMLDRYLNWLAIICFIGIPIALARVVLPGYFFAWRFWRYLWLVALLVWAVWWIVYLVRVFPEQWRREVGANSNKVYNPDPQIAEKARRAEKAEKEKRKAVKRARNAENAKRRAARRSERNKRKAAKKSKAPSRPR
jgi:hypothetical protein